MFSMLALASESLSTLLSSSAFARAKPLLEPAVPALSLRAKSIDDVLPEGGLPRGAVIEIASPRGLARATSIGLAACASAQAEARCRGTERTDGAWCAWIDPGETLFAPGVVRADVDLTRLLVVRPPPEALARVAVRVAASRAFAVIVIDVGAIPGSRLSAPQRMDRWPNVVRRLALAVEGTDTSVILITDGRAARSVPLPVAMRLEVERPSIDRLLLRVAKDRRGRVGAAAPITMRAIA